MTDSEFRAAFEGNKDAVYRYAWRMTGSAAAAEDVAQEVFLTLLRQPGRFDPARAQLRSFLLGIARNLSLKRLRAECRWDSLDDEFDVPAVLPPTDGDVARVVASAMAALPPLQREVVALVEYEGLSLEDTARAVQAEVGTVKSRLFRARENLRKMLAPLREVHR